MSATRTQIYLTEQQRQSIDRLAQMEGVSLAEVVRRAVDAYLAGETFDAEQALAETFGADPQARAPERGEWQRG
jgi:hypothetical protein